MYSIVFIFIPLDSLSGSAVSCDFRLYSYFRLTSTSDPAVALTGTPPPHVQAREGWRIVGGSGQRNPSTSRSSKGGVENSGWWWVTRPLHLAFEQGRGGGDEWWVVADNKGWWWAKPLQGPPRVRAREWRVTKGGGHPSEGGGG